MEEGSVKSLHFQAGQVKTATKPTSKVVCTGGTRGSSVAGYPHSPSWNEMVRQEKHRKYPPACSSCWAALPEKLRLSKAPGWNRIALMNQLLTSSQWAFPGFSLSFHSWPEPGRLQAKQLNASCKTFPEVFQGWWNFLQVTRKETCGFLMWATSSKRDGWKITRASCKAARLLKGL